MLLSFFLALAAADAGSNPQAAETVPPPPLAQTEQPAAERRICRVRLETGSNVRRRKVCFTAEQWRRHDDAARELGQDIQDRNRGAPSGSN